MKQQHLVTLTTYSRADLHEIFDLAARMKADRGAYRDALRGKSLAMIFEKPSTRTRISRRTRNRISIVSDDSGCPLRSMSKPRFSPGQAFAGLINCP